MFGAAARLLDRGVAFALITVVRRTAPTSGKPGDKAILTEDGEWLGWVGGSCAEPVARKAATAALRDGQCRLIHVTNEEGGERPGVELAKMSCYSGGSLELYVEPHLPAPRLTVFGQSPIALALAELGRALGYAVTAVNLREQRLETVQEPPRSSAVVVASHGQKELEALEWALEREVAYVGLVTSQRRWSEVSAGLTARGLGVQLPRVHAPAGLDLGATEPQEVALSIFAQIVSLRRRAAEARPEPSAKVAATAASAAAATPAVPAAPAAPAPAAAPTTATPSTTATPAAPAASASLPSCCCADPEPAQSPDAAQSPEPRFSALILAAGLSRRMGAPNKLLLPVRGVPMVVRVVEAVRGAGPVELCVVLGHQASEVGRVLEPLGVRTVFNPDFASGQVTSVRTGLSALSQPADAVMICLADQPLLTSADLRRLQSAFAERPHGSMVVPMCGPLRGNPVMMDWASAAETLARGTNFGCRQFMDQHPERVYFWQSDSDHFVRDVDQPADYQALAVASGS